MSRRHPRRGSVFPAIGPKSVKGRKAARDALIGTIGGLLIGQVICEVGVALLRGDFFYRNNDGQMERAFIIRPRIINGHDVYIDFAEGVVVHEWSDHGGYRVTPWMRVENP